MTTILTEYPQAASRAEFEFAAPELWTPYDIAANQYALFSRDPDFIRLAQMGVDPVKVAATAEQIGQPDAKNGMMKNGRQLQTQRGVVQQWCQSAAHAPSISTLYDHWSKKFPAIDLKGAVTAQEKIQGIASSFSSLNVSLQKVVTTVSEIGQEWAGPYGWRTVALSLARQISSNPKDAAAKKKFLDLFDKFLIPQLTGATAASKEAQKGTAVFASDIGGAVADVVTISQALTALIKALNTLEDGDRKALKGLQATSAALQKAIPGLAIGGLVGAGVGGVMLACPPPVDVLGGFMLVGSVITELAAIGCAIALAVVAGKMSDLQSKISREHDDVINATAIEGQIHTLAQGGPKVLLYANSFDSAINNVVTDYQNVLQHAKSANPNGEFLVQQVGAIDNAWTEVFHDGETLKNLGIVIEQPKTLQRSDWSPRANETPQSYLERINQLAS